MHHLCAWITEVPHSGLVNKKVFVGLPYCIIPHTRGQQKVLFDLLDAIYPFGRSYDCGNTLSISQIISLILVRNVEEESYLDRRSKGDNKVVILAVNGAR